MKQYSTLILLILMAFTSCTPERDYYREIWEKENPPVDSILTLDKLWGKWEVNSWTYIYSNRYTSGQTTEIAGSGLFYDGKKAGSWDSVKHTSYIIFDKDYTFTQHDVNGPNMSYMLDKILPKHGKWSWMNKDSIILATTAFDSLGVDKNWQILFRNNKLVFSAENLNPYDIGSGKDTTSELMVIGLVRKE